MYAVLDNSSRLNVMRSLRVYKTPRHTQRRRFRPIATHKKRSPSYHVPRHEEGEVRSRDAARALPTFFLFSISTLAGAIVLSYSHSVLETQAGWVT